MGCGERLSGPTDGLLCESRNGLPVLRVRDCSEVEPHEPKLSQGSHPAWSPAYCELEMKNGNSVSSSCSSRLPGHHGLERGLRI